jgi:hypothetical protein
MSLPEETPLAIKMAMVNAPVEEWFTRMAEYQRRGYIPSDHLPLDRKVLYTGQPGQGGKAQGGSQDRTAGQRHQHHQRQFRGKCFNCGETGHRAGPDCPKPADESAMAAARVAWYENKKTNRTAGWSENEAERAKKKEIMTVLYNNCMREQGEQLDREKRDEDLSRHAGEQRETTVLTVNNASNYNPKIPARLMPGFRQGGR